MEDGLVARRKGLFAVWKQWSGCFERSSPFMHLYACGQCYEVNEIIINKHFEDPRRLNYCRCPSNRISTTTVLRELSLFGGLSIRQTSLWADVSFFALLGVHGGSNVLFPSNSGRNQNVFNLAITFDNCTLLDMIFPPQQVTKLSKMEEK